MSVTVEVRKDNWVSDGTLDPRTIPFPFDDPADIVVTVDWQPRTLDAHYSISGTYPDAELTPLAGFATNGQAVRLRRVTSPLQDYAIVGPELKREALETVLDRTVMTAQDALGETVDLAGRSFRVKEGQSFPEIDKTTFAGKFYGGGAGGDPVPLSGTGADAALRSDMAADADNLGLGLSAFSLTRTYPVASGGQWLKRALVPDGTQISSTITSASLMPAGNRVVVNNSTVGQYSDYRLYYTRAGNLADGNNDITNTIISRMKSIQSGRHYIEWRVMMSPLAFGSGFNGAPSVAQAFYLTTREINPVNRHGQLTFKPEPRLYANLVAGDQMVAETQDFSGEVGIRIGYDLGWAYWVSRSPYAQQPNAQHARFNTILGVSPNSISPGGVGFYATGYKQYFYGANNVTTPGSGYVVGDRLTGVTGADQNYSRDPVFEVVTVNGTGGVLTVRILEAGGMAAGVAVPATLSTTGGNGSGCEISGLLTSVEADERPWSWAALSGRWTYGIDLLKPNTVKATFSGAFLRVPSDTIVLMGRNNTDGADVSLLKWAGDDVLELGQSGTNVRALHNMIAAAFRVGGNQVVGAQQAAIAAPSGGGTIDSEGRTVIGDILTALRAHGLIAT
jgi:hypothetical protein